MAVGRLEMCWEGEGEERVYSYWCWVKGKAEEESFLQNRCGENSLVPSGGYKGCI